MNRVERLIASPLGALVARPWFDRATIGFFERWFFPCSRLWAAARAANGSVDGFFEQAPMAATPRFRRRARGILGAFQTQRRVVEGAESVWERAFFGLQPSAEADRDDAESNRLAQRARYNQLRRRFAWFVRRAAVTPVRWEISTPMQLAALYASVVRSHVSPFAAPEHLPEVARSRPLQSSGVTEYWIRFASPSGMADQVVARVSEPEGVVDPPTVIFLHGVCVEFDHWHGMIDEARRLVDMGIRVVRPEAPWHGRRVLPGQYGGEKFIASLPLGTLEFFSAQVREVAVLMDWCRRHTGAAVALGGSSLGAHVSRVAASWSRAWPLRLRPDALFLVTPCGRLEDAAIEGAFARVWGTAKAAGARGWSPELRSKWLSIIDPVEPPAVSPERTVAVLGERDQVTPYPSGRALIDRLGIPAENVFVRSLGHFTIPLDLVRDPAPLQRFHQILQAAPT